MAPITITEKDLQVKFDNALMQKKPTIIKTAKSEGFLISKEEYEGWLETSFLKSIPGMDERIQEGLNTPIEEYEDFDFFN
ncbi:MAG: type II toxin-antitoxin system prevent-host-death family antitoxin [Firmicutes bacterium]|nr:type II toxin-antitoxin system prevent-host-death family antitoxin [Bacillota bacterium]